MLLKLALISIFVKMALSSVVGKNCSRPDKNHKLVKCQGK